MLVLPYCWVVTVGHKKLFKYPCWDSERRDDLGTTANIMQQNLERRRGRRKRQATINSNKRSTAYHLISVKVVTAVGVKKHITSCKFKTNASKGPKISWCGILRSKYHLWTPVLSRLDIICKLFVCPACISKVHQFTLQVNWGQQFLPCGAAPPLITLIF